MTEQHKSDLGKLKKKETGEKEKLEITLMKKYVKTGKVQLKFS